jgi:hypothetical protein
LHKEINTKFSRVCGLAAQQRVSLTLQGFDDLTKNEIVELFKNSNQAYVEYSEELKKKGKKVATKIKYSEELKKKGKKVATKIISHACRTYKSGLVKHWRNKTNPFSMYKDLREDVGVKYPRYRGSSDTARISGHGQFPLAANGWGTIHLIPDNSPTTPE